MKKKGFTIVELLVIMAVLGVILGFGGISIRKQRKNNAILRVRNELGEFFRVTAKRALETGRRQGIDFDLENKKIEIYRVEDSNGVWKVGGTRHIIRTLNLPKDLEYIKKKSDGTYVADFDNYITSWGNISRGMTIYVTEKNTTPEIDGSEEIRHAVSLSQTSHIKYLSVREYTPITTLTIDEAVAPSSMPEELKRIR